MIDIFIFTCPNRHQSLVSKQSHAFHLKVLSLLLFRHKFWHKYKVIWNTFNQIQIVIAKQCLANTGFQQSDGELLSP